LIHAEIEWAKDYSPTPRKYGLEAWYSADKLKEDGMLAALAETAYQ
jgi:hypothetical protein